MQAAWASLGVVSNKNAVERACLTWAFSNRKAVERVGLTWAVSNRNAVKGGSHVGGLCGRTTAEEQHVIFEMAKVKDVRAIAMQGKRRDENVGKEERGSRNWKAQDQGRVQRGTRCT